MTHRLEFTLPYKIEYRMQLTAARNQVQYRMVIG